MSVVGNDIANDPWSSVALRPRPIQLTRIERENYRTATFTFDASVEAKPGQYGMLWLPGIDEKPFSLISGDPITVTVAAVGPFTRALHALRLGDIAGFRGPFGEPFRVDGGRLLLCGGGYGVAPLLFLAKTALAQGCEVAMVTGARTADDLLFVERFQEGGCPVVVATDDGSSGRVGLASSAVEDLIAKRRPDRLYGCGPEGLLVALSGIAQRFDLPAQLSVERYFKCAVGVCGQCTVGELLACVDGPVIDARRLLAQEDFGHFHRIRNGSRVPLGY